MMTPSDMLFARINIIFASATYTTEDDGYRYYPLDPQVLSSLFQVLYHSFAGVCQDPIQIVQLSPCLKLHNDLLALVSLHAHIHPRLLIVFTCLISLTL